MVEIKCETTGKNTAHAQIKLVGDSDKVCVELASIIDTVIREAEDDEVREQLSKAIVYGLVRSQGVEKVKEQVENFGKLWEILPKFGEKVKELNAKLKDLIEELGDDDNE